MEIWRYYYRLLYNWCVLMNILIGMRYGYLVSLLLVGFNYALCLMITAFTRALFWIKSSRGDLMKENRMYSCWQ